MKGLRQVKVVVADWPIECDATGRIPIAPPPSAPESLEFQEFRRKKIKQKQSARIPSFSGIVLTSANRRESLDRRILGIP